MINIVNKEDCVGCNACVQICPKACISMLEDDQGFLYPKVDIAKCINCGLCEKVCPVINQSEPKEPLSAFAAKNKDEEIRNTSSSGGVFYALAEAVINEDGVVFGARFNENWEVIHDYTETLEGIKEFQRSKYVQSRIGDSFIKVRSFLKEGRKVLFSGTPCQVAGLRLFLRKDYTSQLIYVDFACHGVPSPEIWRKYLKILRNSMNSEVRKNTDFQSTLFGKIPVITGISFRDKRISWEKFGFSVHAVALEGDKNSDFQSTNNRKEFFLFEPLDKNLYMQGFLKDLYLRPSCYACPAKCGKSGSDITLADFWGLPRMYPDLYKEGFFSLVLAKTEKGKEIIMNLRNINLSQVEYNLAEKGNPALVRSSKKPKEYSLFWNKYPIEGLNTLPPILNSMKPSIYIRAIRKTKALIRKVLKK